MRKITRVIGQFLNGSKTPIYHENIDAETDWGHAKDYVEAMWLMLQHDKADDFVIATGQSCSIRTLLQLAFTEVGINIRFRGQGVDEEVVVDSCFETNYRHKGQFSPEQVLVKIDPTYYRPSEVNKL